MKPNPEEFARHVLWRLARLQADTMELKMMTAEVLARLTKKNSRMLQDQWKAEFKKMADELYFKSLKDAGLAQSTDNIQPAKNNLRRGAP